MYQEIDNKITSIGETVTSNFYQRKAPSDVTKFCVWTYFGNELRGDTKNEFEDVYFQIACYDRTLSLAKQLGASIKTAFMSADFSTTNYNCLSKKYLGQSDIPLLIEGKREGIIIKIYLWLQEK